MNINSNIYQDNLLLYTEFEFNLKKKTKDMNIELNGSKAMSDSPLRTLSNRYFYMIIGFGISKNDLVQHPKGELYTFNMPSLDLIVNNETLITANKVTVVSADMLSVQMYQTIFDWVAYPENQVYGEALDCILYDLRKEDRLNLEIDSTSHNFLTEDKDFNNANYEEINSFESFEKLTVLSNMEGKKFKMPYEAIAQLGYEYVVQLN